MYDELAELVKRWRKLSDLMYGRGVGYAGDYTDGRADSLDLCADHVEEILNKSLHPDLSIVVSVRGER